MTNITVKRHSINLATGEHTERKLEGEELKAWIDKNIKAKPKEEKEQQT